MLIVEDLVLLLTDDQRGTTVAGWNSVDLPLAGAVLVELALLGRVDVTRPDEPKPGRLVVRSDAPTDSPLLDGAIGVVRQHEGRKPKDVLAKLGKGVKESVLASLAERGLVRRDDHKVLGLIPRTTWPAADTRYEDDLRRRIAAVLADGAPADARTGALIGLLSVSGTVTQVFDAKALGSTGSELRRVAKQISEHAGATWAPEAVRRAIEEIQAATMVAVTAATTASTAAATS